MPGYSGEGVAGTSSRLSSPVSVAPYGLGYVIVNRGSCRLSMLWANFTMSTLAGNGTCGLTNDGGAATLAAVNPGNGLGVADTGPAGGFVFADGGNSVVRRVLPSGVIVRVAGTGVLGYSGTYLLTRCFPDSLLPFNEPGACAGDFGPATSALLRGCTGVAPDGQGGLYVAGESGFEVTHVPYPMPRSSPRQTRSTTACASSMRPESSGPPPGHVGVRLATSGTARRLLLPPLS